MGVPLTYVFWLSLTSKNLLIKKVNFVGFANYIQVLKDPFFWSSLRLGLIWMFGNWGIQIVLALGIALLLNQHFIGRGVVRGIVLFPYVVPTVVTVVLMKWMFSETYGVINYILVTMGIVKQPIEWFTAPSLAMISAIGIGVWKYFPFMTIAILARLQTIDLQLYSAAKVDGASPFREFIHITLPELKGVLILISLIRCIWMFNMFDIIWMISKGGPAGATETLPVYSYIKAFPMKQFGVGCTVAIITSIFMAAMALIYFKITLSEEKRI